MSDAADRHVRARRLAWELVLGPRPRTAARRRHRHRRSRQPVGDAAPGSDLAADGDNLRAALDAIDGPVLLVGHSYGGAVISDAGAHPNVEHLVYLTAFPLDTGESVMRERARGWRGHELAEAMQFDGDIVTVDPARSVEFFYHDCAPEVAAAAAARLRPMSMAAMAGVTRAVAWREKPATYIVCTDDRAIPVALQRSGAARAGEVLEMPTSHSPFLSRPDELARHARRHCEVISSAPIDCPRARLSERDAVVVGVEVELVRIHHDRESPAARAPTTSMPGMSPTYQASAASIAIASSASWKIRGSGFITPTAPESITHSTATPMPGPTCRISSSARR